MYFGGGCGEATVGVGVGSPHRCCAGGQGGVEGTYSRWDVEAQQGVAMDGWGSHGRP
jgi:hypothetical protein